MTDLVTGDTTVAGAAASIIARGYAVLEAPDILLDRRFYQLWSSFFDDLAQARRPPGSGSAGYHPPSSERAVGAARPDRKEFFHYLEGVDLPPELDKHTRQLFRTTAGWARKVLGEIGTRLEDESRLTSMLASTRRAVLRVTRYELKGLTDGDPAATHTDIDLLTLLPPATEPGLAVLGESGWTPLLPEPGTVIVLAGDLLESATGGAIRAARHKVVSSAGRRMSVSFFANPPDDVVVTESVTAGELFARRMKEMADRDDAHECL